MIKFIVMDKSINNTLNFGWFYGTHKRVTRFALKKIPNLKQHQDQLEQFAQRPDFDEKGLFNNWHFYSPAQEKSFFDFDKKENAFAKYMGHVKTMLEGVKTNNISSYIEHAGRALHYLQDMTQPLHTQKGFVFNKILGLKLHMDFERFVKKNQEDCFGKYIDTPFPDKSFEDIFMDNVSFSIKSQLPTSKNRYAWEYIGRDGINQAIRSTKNFLEKLSNLIGEKQYNLPFDK